MALRLTALPDRANWKWLSERISRISCKMDRGRLTPHVEERKRASLRVARDSLSPQRRYVFSGGVRRAATNPPASSGRNERGDVAQPRKRRAAVRGATRRSATSSTTLNIYAWGHAALPPKAQANERPFYLESFRFKPRSFS